MPRTMFMEYMSTMGWSDRFRFIKSWMSCCLRMKTLCPIECGFLSWDPVTDKDIRRTRELFEESEKEAMNA